MYQLILYAMFVYIWGGLFIVELLYFFVFCLPFEQYWALPVTNMQCSTYHNYSVVQMVFNISSDVGLIIAPLPMIWGARLPSKRKLLLTFIFSLAGFTILAAVLNK